MSDFLQLGGKTFLVQGVANRKSVAWFIASTLEEQGARVIYAVRSDERKKSLESLLGDRPVFVCDVEQEGACDRLAAEVAAGGFGPLHGLVHSVAFANYSEGFKPFAETKRADFLQATAVSAFSLVELAKAFKPHLAPKASVITIGISSLLVTPDNYGYMGPIQAALESSIRFLAKSFSADTEVRFNVVGSGPLKTSASAGIPGYLESYLFAEKLTFRKRNLATQEVANVAVFLLSERSSGLNGTTLVADAGLGSNYFDKDIIRLAMRPKLRRPRETRAHDERSGPQTSRADRSRATHPAMKFKHACIESICAALPDEAWSSAAIEERLRPLYERLKLPYGRLELMTGIKERRMWPEGTRPSDASARAGKAVLGQSALKADDVQVLIHSAVCRDMLEPATAAFVHHKIGLGAGTQIFDLSNACLGFLNGLVTIGAMIDSGQIRCGLVVSGENGRPLVERTINHLLSAPLDRNAIKPFFANLTIGSAAVAAMICHEDMLPAGAPRHRLIAGSCRAATKHSELCQGDTAGEQGLDMQTDSEQLLLAGVEVARSTWADFERETGWNPTTPDRIICHQVGSTHRRKLYETVGLDLAKDFSTFETLGNTGSAALPVTLAEAVGQGAVRPGNKVALLGIGSGINSLMLAVDW